MTARGKANPSAGRPTFRVLKSCRSWPVARNLTDLGWKKFESGEKTHTLVNRVDIGCAAHFEHFDVGTCLPRQSNCSSISHVFIFPRKSLKQPIFVSSTVEKACSLPLLQHDYCGSHSRHALNRPEEKLGTSGENSQICIQQIRRKNRAQGSNRKASRVAVGPFLDCCFSNSQVVGIFLPIRGDDRAADSLWYCGRNPAPPNGWLMVEPCWTPKK